MTHVLFIAAILLVSFVEHTRLSAALAGPDLSIALLAYIIIASSERSVLLRAWLLGLAMDVFNPATSAWYMSWCLFIAVVFLPLRALVFQRSLSGWFIWAVLCHLFMAWLLAGPNQLYAEWTRVVWDALMTGVFAIVLGSLFNELPRQLHPLGGPDVP